MLKMALMRMFLCTKSLQMLKMPLKTRKTLEIHNAEML
jgi:hypothetical protein